VERMLERAPVLQLEAQRLEEHTTSIIGKVVSSSENGARLPNVSSEVKEEVESTRYGEHVIAALQIKGEAENPKKLMDNMGYLYPQKGRKNNINVAIDKLEELALLEVDQNENRRAKGAIRLTELGHAYEVKTEVIKEIKTNSADQNI
jgi:hypothetical protein